MSELLSVAIQYVDDCDFAWSIRGAVIGSPHYNLGDLAKFDMGLEVLCSGVHATDTESWVLCDQAIPSNKNAFVDSYSYWAWIIDAISNIGFAGRPIT